MEQQQFNTMMDEWLKRQEENSGGQSAEVDWAVSAGITDGSRPRAFVTREEATVMLRRALEYFFGQIMRILQED